MVAQKLKIGKQNDHISQGVQALCTCNFVLLQTSSILLVLNRYLNLVVSNVLNVYSLLHLVHAYKKIKAIAEGSFRLHLFLTLIRTTLSFLARLHTRTCDSTIHKTADYSPYIPQGNKFSQVQILTVL